MSSERCDGNVCSSAEYASALRNWMNEVYHWQCFMSSFPYFLASLQTQPTTINSSEAVPNLPQGSSIPTVPGVTQTVPAEPTAVPGHIPNPGLPTESPIRATEYVIPPLWKRFVAETVDFFILFAIKLAVTFAAVDAFDLLSDLEDYDFENFGVDILADYRLALEMTSEILVLEIIHRIGTCVFEALCLHRGSRGIGGATPGKKLMGLKVIRCEWLAPSLNDHILVFPATNLGLKRAVLRSVVKNLSLTLLFPVCFTLFSFQYNRTLYDVLAGSVVVEERPRRITQ